MKRKLRLGKQKKVIDKSLLTLTLILTVLGLIAVADASAPQAMSAFNDKFFFVKQQLVWAGIGIVLLVIFSKIHYLFWEKVALPIFIVGIILLILVVIPGLGSKALGARRWLNLGYFSVQPAEILKFAIALYFAKLVSKGKGIISFLIPLVVAAFLVMLQPDLGTTLVIVAIGMTQIFATGFNFFHFIASLLTGLVATVVLILTSDYRRERLMTFIEQSKDPLGRSYHIRQILFSLGLGGFWGVGLGASRQKYLFLPEAATDSIFAVIAEELGFIGSFILIILFALFIFKCLRICLNAPDKFSQIFSLGLTTWIGAQIFLNIGSMLSVVPLTGVPLPFFSYGGSSLTMILIATGILLNIFKYESKTG